METAGGGAGTATGQALLVGIMNPVEFRNAVMRQRDLVAGGGLRVDPGVALGDESGVLEEIRDSLVRIEKMLADRKA